MKLCDLCEKNPALDAEELRTDSVAILMQPKAFYVLKISKGAHPTKGTPAETFEPIDVCQSCLGGVISNGVKVDKSGV